MADSTQPRKNSSSQPPAPKPSILLVEGASSETASLRAILDSPEYQLVEAHSEAETWERMNAQDFAVILVDLGMSGHGGFDMAERIRADARARSTPLVFIADGDITPAQIEQAYALGAVDLCTRPLTPAVLRAKVRGFVALFEEQQRAKREAEQLRRSEERFRLLVEEAKDYAIFMLDPEGYIVSWNTGAQRIKQYTAKDIIGQHFSKFYSQDAVDRGWPAHELKVAAAEGRFEDEGWRIRKDGSKFWANVIITALRDQGGTLLGFSKITRDMTERKEAEENARRLVEEATARRVAEESARFIEQQRAQLHVTLASIGDAVISTDVEGRIVFLNAVAEKLVGWNGSEAERRNLDEVFRIVNENSRQPVENPAMRALRDGKIVGLANHTVLIARDGSERPIDDSAAPIRDDHGNLFGSVLVFRDITERRRTERALRESERRFREMADAMPQIVWTARPDGSIDYTNRQWRELTGLPAAMANDGWDQILHPDDGGPARERWAASVHSGAPFEMEVRLLDRRGGGYRWHLVRIVAARDDAGAIARWVGAGTDIHEQKRSEASAHFLAAASAALTSVVDYESTLQKVAKFAVPSFADWSAVDIANGDGTLRRLAVAHQQANQVELAHELMREYPPDPQSPGGAFDVLRTRKPQIVYEITDDDLVMAARDPRHLQMLRSLGLKSYMCVPLMVSGVPLGVVTFATAESGRRYTDADLALAVELAHRAGVAIENTRLYQALREADRRKDEFLATLAHELRNPLSPIRNALELLKIPRLDEAAARHSREILERQVHHLVRLVDDLLDVSRVTRSKIELRKEPVEFATVVARAVETAAPLIELQGHHLEISVSSESLLLDADPVRLAQVVANLLTNSAKYTEANGRIWLTAAREENQAVLRVRDTGIGIAPDMLPHVFDLFVQADQTSAKTQGGLGIGLTLVKNLVEMHGGRVEAHSEGLGKGCEFVVRLPLTARQADEPVDAKVAEVSQPAPKSGHRLLVVDDNHDAAISLAMLLRMLGHEVEVANDGRSALEMAPAIRPSVIFLDIGMPGMDGYEVARRLRQRPDMKHVVLVALTGWGQQADRRRSKDAGFNHHLVKPAEAKAIQMLLAEVATQA